MAINIKITSITSIFNQPPDPNHITEIYQDSPIKLPPTPSMYRNIHNLVQALPTVQTIALTEMHISVRQLNLEGNLPNKIYQEIQAIKIRLPLDNHNKALAIRLNSANIVQKRFPKVFFDKIVNKNIQINLLSTLQRMLKWDPPIIVKQLTWDQSNCIKNSLLPQ